MLGGSTNIEMSTKRHIKNEKREIKRVANDLNKNIGRNDLIEKARSQRNVRDEDVIKKQNRMYDDALKRARKMGYNLKQSIKIDNNCTPQACAWLRLMDNPFGAKWENVKVPFYPNGQPVRSSVIRSYGFFEFTTTPNLASVVYWQPNPWRQNYPQEGVGNDVDIVQSVDSYSSTVPAAAAMGTPGCPLFDEVAAGTQGNSGFVRHGVNLGTQHDMASTVLSTDTIMAWNGVATFGGMDPGEEGGFRYRLVAAGLELIPTSPNRDLQGTVDSARIESSNVRGYFNNNTAFAGPTAHIGRADKKISINYLRSSADDHFVHPTGGNTINNQDVTGRRNMIVINPGTDATYGTGWFCQYVAYYEVIGDCVMKKATKSFQQPESAAAVSTALGSAFADPRGATPKEMEKHVEVTTAEQHPQMSKVVGSDNEGHKGMIQKIEDFVGTVGPVAAKIAGTIAALL